MMVKPGALAARLLIMCLTLAAGVAWAGGLDQAREGNQALREGRYAQAIQSLTQAIGSGSLNRRNLAVCYNNRGLSYKAQGQQNEALADFTRAGELDPEAEEAFYNRALTNRALGRLDAAQEDYAQAIKLKPDDPRLYYNRGNLWLEKKRWEKAIEDYGKALQLDPNYHKALANRGLAWGRLDKPAMGLTDLDKALELLPDHQPYLNIRRWLESRQQAVVSGQ